MKRKKLLALFTTVALTVSSLVTGTIPGFAKPTEKAETSTGQEDISEEDECRVSELAHADSNSAEHTTVGSDIAGVSFKDGCFYCTNTSDKEAYMIANLMYKATEQTADEDAEWVTWHRFGKVNPGDKLDTDKTFYHGVSKFNKDGIYYLVVNLYSENTDFDEDGDLGVYYSEKVSYTKPTVHLEKPALKIDETYSVSWDPIEEAYYWTGVLYKDGEHVDSIVKEASKGAIIGHLIREDVLREGKGKYTLSLNAVPADLTNKAWSDYGVLEFEYDGSYIPEHKTVNSDVAAVSFEDGKYYCTNTSDREAYMTAELMYKASEQTSDSDAERVLVDDFGKVDPGKKCGSEKSFCLCVSQLNRDGIYYLEVTLSSDESDGDKYGDLGVYYSEDVRYTKPTVSLEKPVPRIDETYCVSWDPIAGAYYYTGILYKDGERIDRLIKEASKETKFGSTVRNDVVKKGKGKYTLSLNAVPADLTNKAWSDYGVIEFEYDGSEIPEKPVDSKLSLTVPDNGRIQKGKTAVVKAEFSAEVEDKSLNWASSDEKVATVDAAGIVTGVGAGEAKITATSKSDPTISATCTVTVFSPVTGIRLSKDKLEMEKGDEKALTATVEPEDADNTEIKWTSSDEKVATVKDGIVTAVGEGDAVITAVSMDGNDVTATCSVKVGTKKVELANAVLPSKITMKSDATYDLGSELELYPANATDVKVTWNSQKSDIAEVSNEGRITAKKAGKTTVTATVTGEGNYKKDLKCTVTVMDATKEIKVTKVALSQTKVGMGTGTTVSLTASVTPKVADDTKLDWTVVSGADCVDIATAGCECVITAKKAGKAVISVKNEKYNKSAKCTVTVGNPVESIEISGSKTVVSGKSTTLKAAVKGASGSKPSNTSVIWSVTDGAEHAMIDSKGKVTGISAGKVTVTAASTESSGEKTVSAVYDLEVVIPIKKLVLSKSKTDIDQFSHNADGTYEPVTDSVQVSTLQPENASNTRITWSVNNSGLKLGVKSADGSVKYAEKYGDSVDADLSRGETLVYMTSLDAAGKTTITGKANDGSKKSVKCTVNVVGKMKDEDVKINIKQTSGFTVTGNNSKSVTVEGLRKKKNVALHPVLTSTAKDKKVTFESSDTSIATVTKKGNVKGLKAGTATITMKTNDGGYVATCTVTVTD